MRNINTGRKKPFFVDDGMDYSTNPPTASDVRYYDYGKSCIQKGMSGDDKRSIILSWDEAAEMHEEIKEYANKRRKSRNF